MSLADDALRLLTSINDKVITLLSRQIAASQIVIIEGLSDFSETLGLIRAGEFRSGNTKDPGDGFIGVRMGYPAFIYDGDEYNLVGINNDILQFGLSAEDGTALAGAGAVKLTADGIEVYNGATQTGKWDADGDFATGEDVSTPAKLAFQVFSNAQVYNGESMGAGDILMGDNSSGKPNILWDSSIPELQVRLGTIVTAKTSGGRGFSGIGCKARRTTDQSIPRITDTALSFSEEEYDDSSFWIPGSPTRLTIPAGMGGTYLVGSSVHWEPNSTGTYRVTGILKNGTDNIGSVTTPEGAATSTAQNLSCMLELSAGDYIELIALQDSPTDSIDIIQFADTPNFWLFRMR